MGSEIESSVPVRRLSCSTCFDALWFCYSPVHQMQQYYRLGSLDNCSEKWSVLWDCLSLKTKPSSQIQVHGKRKIDIEKTGYQNRCYNRSFATVNAIPGSNFLFLFKEIMETREKAKSHIWTFRTPEEAQRNWKDWYGHLDDMQ